MAIVREFNLFTNAGVSTAPVVHVNQYDHDETWLFTLFDESGAKVNTVSAAILGTKADGHVILNDAYCVDGVVHVLETIQMTAAPGRGTFEIVFDGANHGTANFIIQVEPRPGDTSNLSSSDLSLLEQAIQYGTNMMGTVGVTNDVKVALLNLLDNVAYVDQSGQQYYDALRNALMDMGTGTGGGGGGTSDYDQLSNRPQINNVTLTGNKSASDLGLATTATATTLAAGLMSATDKSHLDDVYADYSSALAALGV